eukprot:3970687-Alexandrium_andersonii.AAC.1
MRPRVAKSPSPRQLRTERKAAPKMKAEWDGARAEVISLLASGVSRIGANVLKNIAEKATAKRRKTVEAFNTDELE